MESPPLDSHWLNALPTQHAYLRDEPPIGRRLASLMASDWPISSHRPSLGRSGKESLSRPAPPPSCLAIGAIACHSVLCVLYWLEESVSQAEAFFPPLSGEPSPRGRAVGETQGALSCLLVPLHPETELSQQSICQRGCQSRMRGGTSVLR